MGVTPIFIQVMDDHDLVLKLYIESVWSSFVWHLHLLQVHVLTYTLWQINIDPGSHRGWKISETIKTRLFSGSMLIYQRVLLLSFKHNNDMHWKVDEIFVRNHWLFLQVPWCGLRRHDWNSVSLKLDGFVKCQTNQ